MKKVLALVLALIMVFAIAAPVFAGNDKINNQYGVGAELQQDFNNAQFHCNAINGNGRVWPETPTDMKKFEGQLRFTKAEGTLWNLSGVYKPILDPKGKVTGKYESNSSDMVVCPVCGSTEWITFSNNSGVPDGKNVQMQHPGYYITIVKEWIKNNSDEYYTENGINLIAYFTIKLTNGKTFTVSVKKSGNFLIPNDLTVESVTEDEAKLPEGFLLVDSSIEGNVYTFVNEDEKVILYGTATVTVYKEWDAPEWFSEELRQRANAVLGGLADSEKDPPEIKGFGDSVTYNWEVGNEPTVILSETFESEWEEGGYKYTVSLKEIYEDPFSVGNVLIEDGVATVVLDDEDNVILTFVNVISREKIVIPPIIIGEKLPSDSHADLWWNNTKDKDGHNFWILAYGANTTAEGDYFIFLGEAFFDDYVSIKIGFGTKTDIHDEMVITQDDLEWQPNMVYEIGTHYTDPYNTAPFDFGPGWFSWFGNPHGSGGEQIWLLEIQPK